MKPCPPTALALALALMFLAPIAAAERLHDLSDPEPKAGDVIESKMDFTGEDGKLQVLFGGQAVAAGSASMKMHESTTRSVVAVKDGVVTQYTTRITASEHLFVTEMDGAVEKEKEASPLLDKTVTWKLVDGQYVPELPGATEEQLAELEPQPLTDVEVYPAEPVAIGHRWELDRETIAEILDQALDDKFKGSGQLEFVGVEDYKGEPCAKLKVKLEAAAPMPEDELEEGMNAGEISIALEGHIYRSLKHRVDTGVDMAGTFKIDLTGGENDEAFQVAMQFKAAVSGGEKRGQ